MKQDLSNTRETVSLLYVSVLSYDDLPVYPSSICDRTGALHVVEIGCKLADFFVDRIVLLRHVDHITVVLAMQNKEPFAIVTEFLKLPAVGVKCDLVEQDKTVAGVVKTEIGKVNLVTAFYVVVAENALVFALPFPDPLQFLRGDLRKHGRLAASR